ncbi:hypothetical protein FHS27_001104 [Rhodopirellula rubra]|uniref:Uncharacterized protein n=1 Tax=Aporhodopirellula rubra TaxID=980271 RepID=A0A7W5DVH7_9BACT|nr:hypothetical protein [Aporhodopirellula rubra]
MPYSAAGTLAKISRMSARSIQVAKVLRALEERESFSRSEFVPHSAASAHRPPFRWERLRKSADGPGMRQNRSYPVTDTQIDAGRCSGEGCLSTLVLLRLA